MKGRDSRTTPRRGRSSDETDDPSGERRSGGEERRGRAPDGVSCLTSGGVAMYGDHAALYGWYALIADGGMRRDR